MIDTTQQIRDSPASSYILYLVPFIVNGTLHAAICTRQGADCHRDGKKYICTPHIDASSNTCYRQPVLQLLISKHHTCREVRSGHGPVPAAPGMHMG
jgi:hypothetical protein